MYRSSPPHEAVQNHRWEEEQRRERNEALRQYMVMDDEAPYRSGQSDEWLKRFMETLEKEIN